MASMNHQKGLQMQAKSNLSIPERISRTAAKTGILTMTHDAL
jgi:hypothetical protein